MKIKLICLLAVLFCIGLAASPNSYCDARCPGKSVKSKTTSTAQPVVMVIDEMELLPIHYFINHF